MLGGVSDGGGTGGREVCLGICAVGGCDEDGSGEEEVVVGALDVGCSGD